LLRRAVATEPEPPRSQEPPAPRSNHFDLLGAGPWAERCRTELAKTGETIDRSRNGRTLTPQERQVAHLVAGGATNREAAASLFVNLKTIEFDLGNIYRKLGIRSRTELANALWRRES
jgi:DNA-binding CsgD family transcriptional regulator